MPKNVSSDADGLTVIEQIDDIADRQLSLDYFEKRTTAGDVEAALQERVQRDDRVLLVCFADETIAEINEAGMLCRTDEVLGFAFFGTYSVEEMDEYMAVPFEEVFSPENFPVGHFRNVTVRGDAQDSQISSRMISRVIEGLYDLGHDIWVVLLRNRPDIDTPEYAEDFGAERIREYEDYFDDRTCAHCGPNCECTFVFYRMEIG